MATDRFIVVSGDCHVDPASPDAFKPYLEKRYHADFDQWRATTEEVAAQRRVALEGGDTKTPYFDRDYFTMRGKQTRAFFERLGYDEDTYSHRLNSLLSFTSDPEVRLKELEADGVVVECMFPNGPMPFAGLEGGDAQLVEGAGRELQRAGIMAYNRWLGEICQAHPTRRIGTAVLPPTYDVDDTVQIIREAKEMGLGGVGCPRPWLQLPPLIDPMYDPIWAVCAELNMPLHCHSGWGNIGGSGVDKLRGDLSSPAVRGLMLTESYFLSRRALWILIWSGAFDRHPNLRLMFVEQQADWAPATLAWLDSIYDSRRHGYLLRETLKRRPSEYWPDHCLAMASFISRLEVELRNDIGITSLGFGTDYPHPEATWPNTTAWLNAAFAGQGVTEQEARAILGENAIRFYGLDKSELQKVANRVGPTVDEVLVPDTTVDPELLAWMQGRELGRNCVTI